LGTGTEVAKEGEVLVGSEKGMKQFQFLQRRKCLQPPSTRHMRPSARQKRPSTRQKRPTKVSKHKANET